MDSQQVKDVTVRYDSPWSIMVVIADDLARGRGCLSVYMVVKAFSPWISSGLAPTSSRRGSVCGTNWGVDVSHGTTFAPTPRAGMVLGLVVLVKDCCISLTKFHPKCRALVGFRNNSEATAT